MFFRYKVKKILFVFLLFFTILPYFFLFFGKNYQVSSKSQLRDEPLSYCDLDNTVLTDWGLVDGSVIRIDNSSWDESDNSYAIYSSAISISAPNLSTELNIGKPFTYGPNGTTPRVWQKVKYIFQYSFSDSLCPNLKRINIYNVETIDSATFYSSHITTVTFDATLKKIGGYGAFGAFENCRNLTYIYVASSVPPELVTMYQFTGCMVKYIFVNESVVNIYKNASNWKNYAQKIFPYITSINITSTPGNLVFPNNTTSYSTAFTVSFLPLGTANVVFWKIINIADGSTPNWLNVDPETNVISCQQGATPGKYNFTFRAESIVPEIYSTTNLTIWIVNPTILCDENLHAGIPGDSGQWDNNYTVNNLDDFVPTTDYTKSFSLRPSAPTSTLPNWLSIDSNGLIKWTDQSVDITLRFTVVATIIFTLNSFHLEIESTVNMLIIDELYINTETSLTQNAITDVIINNNTSALPFYELKFNGNWVQDPSPLSQNLNWELINTQNIPFFSLTNITNSSCKLSWTAIKSVNIQPYLGQTIHLSIKAISVDEPDIMMLYPINFYVVNIIETSNFSKKNLLINASFQNNGSFPDKFSCSYLPSGISNIGNLIKNYQLEKTSAQNIPNWLKIENDGTIKWINCQKEWILVKFRVKPIIAINVNGIIYTFSSYTNCQELSFTIANIEIIGDTNIEIRNGVSSSYSKPFKYKVYPENLQLKDPFYSIKSLMPQTNWLFIANDGNEKFQRGTLYWDNYPQNALRDFTLNVYGNIDDIDGEVHYFNSFPFGISINEKFTNQILAICLISLTSIVSVSVLIVIGVQTRHYIHRRINKKLVKKV